MINSRYILIIFTVVIFSKTQSMNAQIDGILPGTLTITSNQLNFTTNATNPIPLEAGSDALLVDESLSASLDFKLDTQRVGLLGLVVLGPEYVCLTNLYDYDVYMSTANFPQVGSENVKLEARITDGTGQLFPTSLPPARLVTGLLRLLGLSAFNQGLYTAYTNTVIAQAATPANGGAWIVLPPDTETPVKVFSFRGCRTNMQVEFRLTVNSVNYSVPDFSVNYFISATDLLEDYDE